jgi:hypothetical protein
LPKMHKRNPGSADISRYSVPFSKVKQEMGELRYSSNTESSELWQPTRSNDFYVPLGLKSYDRISMDPIELPSRYKEDSLKTKYMQVFASNPYSFYRKSGEFTKYINSSIRVNKTGPHTYRKIK